MNKTCKDCKYFNNSECEKLLECCLFDDEKQRETQIKIKINIDDDSGFFIKFEVNKDFCCNLFKKKK